jgi:hypothetical protein
MRLRHAVFAGWITGLAFLGYELSLTSDATLELRLNFVAAALFNWIRATAG